MTEHEARAERFKLALQSITRLVDEAQSEALEDDAQIDGWALTNKIRTELARAYEALS